MESLHKKSQKPNIIAPRPTRIKFDCWSTNLKKAQCFNHQSSQWTKKTPTMPWRTQRTDHDINECIALRHAIQDLIDQKAIAPSSPGGQFNLSWAKWSLHKLPSQNLIHGVFLSFFCLSSICLLIWILRNMLLRFWFWTYHRNVCLNFLFTFFILFF